MTAVDVVNDYLHGLPGGARRLAHTEWGLTIAAETLGEPLDVCLSIADGLLRVKAPALGAGHEHDPWMLLCWRGDRLRGTRAVTRQARQVRFGSTRSREIWLHADLPASALNEPTLDRLLGLVVEAVVAARGLSHYSH
jgi:hypothetical protein